jgi:hypothetical protein
MTGLRPRLTTSTELIFEIESWARSGDRVVDFLYDRLGIAPSCSSTCGGGPGRPSGAGRTREPIDLDG